MSDVMHNLKAVRTLAWRELRPAINHAIALAQEAEFIAHQASNAALTNAEPAYPPIVWLLAKAAPMEVGRWMK